MCVESSSMSAGFSLPTAERVRVNNSEEFRQLKVIPEKDFVGFVKVMSYLKLGSSLRLAELLID